MLRIPVGWTSGGALQLLERQQLFVLNGELQLGDIVLGQNAYVCQPAGSVMSEFGSDDGVELILIADGTPAFAPAANGDSGGEARVIEDAFSLPCLEPELDGWVLEGIEDRTLIKDGPTGADTGILKLPAGFEGGGANYHPVNQEIFCLAGDIGPDDDRLMKPGWFLWNPAFGVHGFREHSIGGATVLRWHDGEFALHMYEGGASSAA